DRQVLDAVHVGAVQPPVRIAAVRHARCELVGALLAAQHRGDPRAGDGREQHERPRDESEEAPERCRHESPLAHAAAPRPIPWTSCAGRVALWRGVRSAWEGTGVRDPDATHLHGVSGVRRHGVRYRLWDMDRLVALQGCLNFRDLGGYPTRDGRWIRWRRMFRSDALHGLTVADVACLRDEIGLTTVVDLRSS